MEVSSTYKQSTLHDSSKFSDMIIDSAIYSGMPVTHEHFTSNALHAPSKYFYGDLRDQGWHLGTGKADRGRSQKQDSQGQGSSSIIYYHRKIVGAQAGSTYYPDVLARRAMAPYPGPEGLCFGYNTHS